MTATDKIKSTLDGYVAEALQLRFDAQPPKPDASSAVLIDTLTDARIRLDRIEELYSKALQLRGQARRAAAISDAVAKDASAQAAHANRQVRRDDYTTGEERHAEVMLQVMQEIRAARELELLRQQCDEAVELLRLTHRGIEGVRQDVLALIRLFQFESTLDR